MGERPCILMVEDNENVLTANRLLFERDGYAVRTAETLAQARRELAAGPVDLVLLDVILPDGSGPSLVPEIRAAGDARILMLSSRRQYQDILDGLTGGADDYMTKPYRNMELKARVAALLVKGSAGADRAGADEPRLLTRGRLTLDERAMRGFVEGRDMALTPKEFALLKLLVRNEGTTLSRRTLYEQVWSQAANDDDRAVKTHLSNLRGKLEGSGYTIISLWREGYRFEAEE